MRIDIGLRRTTNGSAGRDGPAGGARWPANWHFADRLIGHCTRKLHYGPRPPSNVIEKNERNKGRETESRSRATDSKACEKEGRKEGNEGGSDGERYDDGGNGLRFIGSARRLSLISPITHHSYLMDSMQTDPPFCVCFLATSNLAGPSMTVKCEFPHKVS